MINIYEVTETNNMVEKENLDVRTITMGISLLDCIDSDLNACLDKIYKKITESAKDLAIPKPLLLVICLSRSFPSSIAFDMFGK